MRVDPSRLAERDRVVLAAIVELRAGGTDALSGAEIAERAGLDPAAAKASAGALRSAGLLRMRITRGSAGLITWQVSDVDSTAADEWALPEKLPGVTAADRAAPDSSTAGADKPFKKVWTAFGSLLAALAVIGGVFGLQKDVREEFFGEEAVTTPSSEGVRGPLVTPGTDVTTTTTMTTTHSTTSSPPPSPVVEELLVSPLGSARTTDRSVLVGVSNVYHAPNFVSVQIGFGDVGCQDTLRAGESTVLALGSAASPGAWVKVTLLEMPPEHANGGLVRFEVVRSAGPVPEVRRCYRGS
ncbi:hypothetical protein IOD16_38305 [Saccharothrix sp. 6-C]|uniref:hypothetical protein n=1 Tax=Saccharothrix sp. 6-C TaxID=2781735 RepID=UPI001917A066|nr:hypothetical protein [Saccharothrix sp. 6-C]QQQ76756.1 hypothetical protein IOD16_38305 [Saccharothrix sp. 6-C]